VERLVLSESATFTDVLRHLRVKQHVENMERSVNGNAKAHACTKTSITVGNFGNLMSSSIVHQLMAAGLNTNTRDVQNHAMVEPELAPDHVHILFL